MEGGGAGVEGGGEVRLLLGRRRERWRWGSVRGEEKGGVGGKIVCGCCWGGVRKRRGLRMEKVWD